MDIFQKFFTIAFGWKAMHGLVATLLSLSAVVWKAWQSATGLSVFTFVSIIHFLYIPMFVLQLRNIDTIYVKAEEVSWWILFLGTYRGTIFTRIPPKVFLPSFLIQYEYILSRNMLCIHLPFLPSCLLKIWNSCGVELCCVNIRRFCHPSCSKYEIHV